MILTTSPMFAIAEPTSASAPLRHRSGSRSARHHHLTRPKITPAARRHLTALVFVFMALKAIAYWLDRYGLVFSSRSTFTGASESVAARPM